jgi:hypothetical protein
MYLLGATLTKFIATITALLTVTAGLPHLQCQCPNGQVMLFCQGNTSSPSGCCCATSGSSATEIKACCCSTKKEKAQKLASVKHRSCCTHSTGDLQHDTGKDNSVPVVKAPSCMKTVVTADPTYTIANADIPIQPGAGMLVGWEPVYIPPTLLLAPAAARLPPKFHPTPPDLVVILCHFTC